MDTATRSSPRWWRSRRFKLFLIAGILAVLVIRIGLDVWAGGRVRAAVDRLEARYGSLEPGAGWPPAVPDADNRARLVEAAAALVMPGTATGTIPMARAIAEFRKLPPPALVPGELREFVRMNRGALGLVDQARGLRQANWNLDYQTFDDTPPLLELRTLSNAVHVAALLDVEAGRPDEASRSLEGGLAVASSLGQEPMLIIQLIRIAVALEQFEGVEELISRSEPSAAALEGLADRLREAREPDPLSIGLVGELRYSNAMLAAFDRGRAPWLSPGGGPSLRAWLLLMVGRPFVRLSRARYLDRMDALIEIQRGPRPRPSWDEGAEVRWLDQRLLSTAGFERAMETGDQYMGALAVTELGVALRRYRLDRGEYPDELPALVPAYLPDVPIDPFTGVPPVYARQGDGFTLWAEAGRNDRANYPALDWAVNR